MDVVVCRGITRLAPRLCLVYSEEYAEQPTASPLSLSMPLQVAQVDDRRVENWISGLLPGQPLGDLNLPRKLVPHSICA
ncbi:MAG: HipA N-terminal domain-containing protein [Acidimicrobiia bacterium]|nr:HipA N-terminal domain-containing protein [Acidimicrobiia bacterium]